VENATLVTNKFRWFRNAQFEGACFAPGFENVLLGRAHKLGCNRNLRNHHGTSSFFEMP
jgi:hypothetical protein